MPNPDPRAAGPALSIIRDRYVDFGSTLACEKLRECHGIRLAKETSIRRCPLEQVHHSGPRLSVSQGADSDERSKAR
jgi:hypothetical protein